MKPFYITISKYPELGYGACDPTDFDGACDQLAEFRRDYPDWECRVFRCEPGISYMEDVTADACQRIVNRLTQRGYDFPQWLIDEVAA